MSDGKEDGTIPRRDLSAEQEQHLLLSFLQAHRQSNENICDRVLQPTLLRVSSKPS